MRDERSQGARTKHDDAEDSRRAPGGSGRSEADRAERESQHNWLERAVTWLSALLVAASVVVLVWQGLHANRPPLLTVTVDSLRTAGDQHYLHLTVRNEGEQTARGAEVSVTLLQADTSIAESSATIDWIPGRSEATATVIFRDDPGTYRAEARIEGYTEP